VPDATELELTAQELRDAHSDSILDTEFHRGRATLVANPKSIKAILEHLRDSKGYTFLASVHGVDYYPQEPRLGVLYEMLDRQRVDRLSVKARLHTDDPHIDSVVDLFPSADFQERETYDMFGVVFDGHPDMRRILMPEDYEGFPQRRDFPVGGEPILFTYNEEQNYGKYV
jgi:NADH-quinone oxidoreductase subunit C